MGGTAGFFGWDGPGVDKGSGMEKMLRTSAAEVANAMFCFDGSLKARVTCNIIQRSRNLESIDRDRLRETDSLPLRAPEDRHGRICKCVSR